MSRIPRRLEMGSRRAMAFALRVMCVLTALAASPAYGQSSTKPCDLVTKEQVSSAVGSKVNPGEAIGTTGCQWSIAPTAKTGRVMVTLSIWGEKWFPTKETPGIPMKPVSGIGDKAVFSTLGDLTSLFVKKGKSTLQFRVYGLHDTAKQEQIEMSIGKAALARW